MIPISMFAVTADESYEGIEKTLDEKLISPLNRIDGIGSINIFGAPIREISIDINPVEMEAHSSGERAGIKVLMEAAVPFSISFPR